MRQAGEDGHSVEAKAQAMCLIWRNSEKFPAFENTVRDKVSINLCCGGQIQLEERSRAILSTTSVLNFTSWRMWPPDV